MPDDKNATTAAKDLVGTMTGGFLGRLAGKAAVKKQPVGKPVGLAGPPDAMAGMKRHLAARAARRRKPNALTAMRKPGDYTP